VIDVLTRADLIRDGMTSRAITAAVRSGALIRARQDNYLPGDAARPLVEAVRVGGRLGCLSLLALLEVFVYDSDTLHVHMERGDSRMRSTRTRRMPLATRAKRRDVVLHWHRLTERPRRGQVGVFDAIVNAVRCQEPRYAIATLDSALNKKLIRPDQISEVFAALPRRFQILRGFVDGRAQAGTETLVRLMAIRLGCDVDLQVRFDGVGFVDLVIDGWLVVECDSKAFHSTWEQQLKDYRRDLALAAAGYCVLRLTAEDILYRPEAVLESLRGLLLARAGA
jgi:very-short-patch-repair endonuclease